VIRELYRNSEICQRLGKVEGIGPVSGMEGMRQMRTLDRCD
jgi:hypothetical protein